MIDLKQPRLQFRVKQDVESKNLEAKLIFYIIRLAGPVKMCNGWLTGDKSLYNYILYPSLAFLNLRLPINSLNLLDIAPYLGHTFLMGLAAAV